MPADRLREGIGDVSLHALWDISLLSGRAIPGQIYRLSLVAILTMVVLAIVVFARRKHIEPTPS